MSQHDGGSKPVIIDQAKEATQSDEALKRKEEIQRKIAALVAENAKISAQTKTYRQQSRALELVLLVASFGAGIAFSQLFL